MAYLVLIKDVIKVDGWVLKVSWVVDGISEESEEVSGWYVVIVVDKCVEAGICTYISRPLQTHKRLQRVVIIRVIEVTLKEVPKLKRFPAHPRSIFGPHQNTYTQEAFQIVEAGRVPSKSISYQIVILIFDLSSFRTAERIKLATQKSRTYLN